MPFRNLEEHFQAGLFTVKRSIVSHILIGSSPDFSRLQGNVVEVSGRYPLKGLSVASISLFSDWLR
jgi:hypothetical protein